MKVEEILLASLLCESRSPRNCLSDQDNFCQSIESNQGNLAKNSIYLGTSDKSQLSEAERIDIQALANSFDKLPLDLMAKGKDSFKSLKEHLLKENPSEAWYERLQEIRDEISSQVVETARDRTKNQR